MSAIGTKRTCASALHMSAFGGKADMTFAAQMSAFDPKRTSYVLGVVHNRCCDITLRRLLWKPRTCRRSQMPADAGSTDARHRDHGHLRGAPRSRYAPCCH